MSTLGDVQCIGGYHDACGGYHEYIGRYHEYIGGYRWMFSTSGDVQYIGVFNRN